MFAIDNYDFKGKRAIIRVDFNVPLNEKGEVTDDTRIRAAIPTIKKVLEKGGSVILMSHLGRPKKNPDPKFSLEQIVPAIEKRLGVKVMFSFSDVPRLPKYSIDRGSGVPLCPAAVSVGGVSPSGTTG